MYCKYSLKLYPLLNIFMYKINVEKPIMVKIIPIMNKKYLNII